jgi:hypothetical protein
MEWLFRLFEWASAGIGGRLANSVFQTDYSKDPVYLNKLQELIERNKQFEEERERAERARSGPDEQHT